MGIEEVRRGLVLSFFFITIFGMLFWNISWSLGEDELRDTGVYKLLEYYFLPTGMWQNFNVFAPPPEREFHITVIGRAGAEEFVYEPKYQHNPGFVDERERKWYEAIITSNFASYRPTFLQFWCKEFERMHGMKIDEVTLDYDRITIPDLGEIERERRGARQWDYECP